MTRAHFTLATANGRRASARAALIEDGRPLVDQTGITLQLHSASESWDSQVPYLVRQTGIGLLIAMTWLAAGDLTNVGNRFDSSLRVFYTGPAWKTST